MFTGLVSTDQAMTDRISANLATMREERKVAADMLKRATRKADKNLHSANIAELDRLSKELEAQLPKRVVDVKLAIEDLIYEVRKADPYDKAVAAFKRQFDGDPEKGTSGDPFYAVERFADSIMAARLVHREMVSLAEALARDDMTLDLAQAYIAETRKRLEKQVLETSIMNSTDAWSNTCNLIAFEGLRNFLNRWGGLQEAEYTIKTYLQESAKVGTTTTPAATMPATPGGALVGLDCAG